MTLGWLGARAELVLALVTRDIRSRYAQSVLGIGWAILNPLAMSLIQAAVIVFILRLDTTIPVAVFTYAGNLFWTTFSNGLSGATDSLVGNMNLIARLKFPRETLPAAAILGRLPDFAFGLSGLLVLILLFPVQVSIGAVVVIPLLAIQIVFTTGLGLIAAGANVFFRDARHIVGLMLTLWFYLVPILYPVELVPAAIRPIYMLNPMAAIIDTARRATFPELGGGIEWVFVAIAAITAVGTFVVGVAMFRRVEGSFAEAI